jgi:hypothetical protein
LTEGDNAGQRAGPRSPRRTVRYSACDDLPARASSSAGSYTNVSLASSGLSSALESRSALKHAAFELKSTQRLNRAALDSMRPSGTGCELLDSALSEEM